MRSPVQRDTNLKAQLSILSYTSYYVNGEVHGHALTLVDIWASVTLISKDQVNQAQGVQLEPWTVRQVVSVDGSPLKIYGHTSVAISMGGTAYSVDTVVVSPLTSEAILGVDFLRVHDAIVDVEICMGITGVST